MGKSSSPARERNVQARMDREGVQIRDNTAEKMNQKRGVLKWTNRSNFDDRLVNDQIEQELNRISKTSGADINLHQRSGSDPVRLLHHERDH